MELDPRKYFSGVDASIEQTLQSFGFADQFMQSPAGKTAFKDALTGSIVSDDRAPSIDGDDTAWHLVRDLVVKATMFVVRAEAEKNNRDGDQCNGDGQLGQGVHSAG
jgi:hypothetical protein